MVMDKKTSRTNKSFIIQIIFFLLKIVGIDFVSSTTSRQAITESPTVLPKYFAFIRIPNIIHFPDFRSERSER